MNSNLFHNILNLIGLIVGALVTYDWSGIIADPALAAKIAGIFILVDKVLKLAVNINRDGVLGLVKAQPPVAK